MKYGTLTVIGEFGKKNGLKLVNVRCNCGTEKVVYLNNLKYKKTNSCGKGVCNPLSLKIADKVLHKKMRSIYNGMKTRCNNKGHKAYKNYGGRNIKICDKWEKSFKSFYVDMAHEYKDGLTLDRIDNNKGYSKENCRWTTWEEQCLNKRGATIIKYNGVRDNITGWAKRIGVTYATLQHRLKRGWEVKKALTTPQKR